MSDNNQAGQNFVRCTTYVEGGLSCAGCFCHKWHEPGDMCRCSRLRATCCVAPICEVCSDRLCSGCGYAVEPKVVQQDLRYYVEKARE
jgi:hypothetical protein